MVEQPLTINQARRQPGEVPLSVQAAAAGSGGSREEGGILLCTAGLAACTCQILVAPAPSQLRRQWRRQGGGEAQLGLHVHACAALPAAGLRPLPDHTAAAASKHGQLCSLTVALANSPIISHSLLLRGPRPEGGGGAPPAPTSGTSLAATAAAAANAETGTLPLPVCDDGGGGVEPGRLLMLLLPSPLARCFSSGGRLPTTSLPLSAAATLSCLAMYCRRQRVYRTARMAAHSTSTAPASAPTTMPATSPPLLLPPLLLSLAVPSVAAPALPVGSNHSLSSTKSGGRARATWMSHRVMCTSAEEVGMLSAM